MTGKLFKKILLLTFCIILVFCCSLTVSATDYTYNHTDDEIEEIRTIAHDYLYESIDGAPLEIFVGTKPLDLKFNGYSIIYASYNMELPMIMVKRIGGYIYYDYNYSYPSDLGYLVINPETNIVIELEEAIEDGMVDADALFEYSNIGFDMYLVGDADYDCELSIKDATEVQKAIAEMTEIVRISKKHNETAFDYNNDGQVNIIDSTEIQKALIS